MAALSILGAFSGTAVAQTWVKDREGKKSSTWNIAAAMVGIVVWSTWRWRGCHQQVMPGSGLAEGAGNSESSVLVWDGWRKVLLGLAFPAFLGFLGAATGCFDLQYLLCGARHRAANLRKAQIVSAAFMAYSLAATTGRNSSASSPWPSSSAGSPTFAIRLGDRTMRSLWAWAAIGGWRIVRTMGLRLANCSLWTLLRQTGAALH
jgi:PiT family inorganic phosphate transporter